MPLMLPMRFFAAAEAFFETTLPRLFLKRPSLVRPPLVLALEPLRTMALASLPLAILLTRLAFIALPALAAFIATTFFIGRAMAVKGRSVLEHWADIAV